MSNSQGATSEPMSPYSLPINNPKSISVNKGWNDNAGKKLDANQVAAKMDSYSFAIFGESHDNTDHKTELGKVITALEKRGRNVVLGLEMFTWPSQMNLNPWTMGYWTEAEFIENANWKVEWGFDYSIYKPVFDVVKQNRIPMIALNSPRNWVKQARTQGYDSLPADVKALVPPLDLSNKNHRMVFTSLMGGHGSEMDSQMDSFYTSQTFWDTAMAASAVRASKNRPKNTIFIVLAGSGHALYGQGIDYRITQQTGQKVFTMIGIELEIPTKVSSTLGDVILVTDEPLSRKSSDSK